MGSRGDATMIYWNDKERGYPIGLESGTKGIWISCTACKHSDKWLWGRVSQTWRAGTYTRDLTRSLKCSRCGAKEACVMAWAWGPLENPPDANRPDLASKEIVRRRLPEGD